MKKLIFSFCLFFPLLVWADSNPFMNGRWVNGNVSVSTQQHSGTGGNYEYSISYRLPNGTSFQSDECNATNTILSCAMNIHLTVHLDTHSAVLTDAGVDYIYYETGYEPTGSPLSGDWHPVSNPNMCWYTHLKVPYNGNKEATYFEVEVDTFGGFQFKSYALQSAVHEGKQQLMFGSKYYDEFFLFDGNNNPITDMANLDKVVKLISYSFGGCTYTK